MHVMRGSECTWSSGETVCGLRVLFEDTLRRVTHFLLQGIKCCPTVINISSGILYMYYMRMHNIYFCQPMLFLMADTDKITHNLIHVCFNNKWARPRVKQLRCSVQRRMI